MFIDSMRKQTCQCAQYKLKIVYKTWKQKHVYLAEKVQGPILSQFTAKTTLKYMTAMPVILTGPQTVAQKGPAHLVLFSRRGTSLKLFAIELLYILVY